LRRKRRRRGEEEEVRERLRHPTSRQKQSAAT
jgi:hypothetical protein